MRFGNWILFAALLSLLLCGTASAQLQANQLCMHNGSDFYTNGNYFGFPNWGAGRYFPSFTYWGTTPHTNSVGATVYPWKLAGVAWDGMMGNNLGNNWYWEIALQSSVDNPYNVNPGGFDMSFDYPLLYQNGSVPFTGPPRPLYGITLGTNIPVVGNNRPALCPSSMGGFNAYLNFFSTFGASFTVPSTGAFLGYTFAVTWPCASALTLPSSNSIWRLCWCMKGTWPQYNLKDGNARNCLNAKGNPGRNYSITLDSDNGKYWYWNNTGTGVDDEWATCLLVCDITTMPVNVPGDPGPNNPYSPYGFDIGPTSIMPMISTNCVSLGFVTEDYTGLSGPRIILASFAATPTVGTYGPNNYRMPIGWDPLTGIFLNVGPLFLHNLSPGYPAGMFGTTNGGHTFLAPFPNDPVLYGQEFRYSSFDITDATPMSAAVMTTFF